MTLFFREKPFKIQKKFLAFFGVVPLLLATALIQVPCPVCGGTGYVSSTGMAEVSILSMSSTQQSVFMVGCNTYRVYNTDVTMTLQNKGKDNANGYVSLYLIDFKTSKILDTQFAIVSVPAETVTTTTVTVYFHVVAVDDPQQATNVTATVLDGNVPCKACNGTGKVALNAWPLYNGIKDSFKQTQVVVTPYLPPILVETEGG